MRKIFTLLLLLIPLWVQAQDYTWNEESKTLTIHTGRLYNDTYKTTAETLIIEGTYTKISGNAFKEYTALKKVEIQEGVTSIGSYAFSGCSSLESVTIPNSVTSIENYAFQGCTSLTSIVYEGTKEPKIYVYTFPASNEGITVTVSADYEGDSFGPFTGTQLKGKHYTITIPEQTGGTVKATVNESEVTSAEGGATVTLIATPDDEYILNTLTVTDAQGNPVSVNDNTFIMPAANVTVTATFTAIEKPKPEEPEDPDTPVIPDMPKYYNIMVDECEGVTVETSTSVVREGQSMTFTVDIAEGYSAEDMTVKVKRSLFGYTEVIEPNNEGIYEVKNIYTDIYITVAGVEEEEETPTGMEDVESAKVYTKDGSIYVETPQRVTVSIVSMTGAVVEQAEQIGQKRYDLPRGIYIICIDERRYKVRN